MCIGASGGSRIVTATQQVAMNALLLGMDAGEAIVAPRVHHQASPNQLRSETFAELPAETIAALTARGHVHEPIHNVATVQLIHILRAGGTRRLHAAGDPRKSGRPAGR